MSKITYYLGAGASYNSIPILNRLSEIMIEVATLELKEKTSSGENNNPYSFEDGELSNLPIDNRGKILWYIGYFGKKGILFNTIDTYARKLELTKDITQLHLLKMCISVFFDLWENFHEERYSQLLMNKEQDSNFIEIDNRYKSLFSIFLQNNEGKIELNDDFKFITWNYDLQLESTFKLFLDDEIRTYTFGELNSDYLKFKIDNEGLIANDIFHLNGHRGFYSDFDFKKLQKNYIEPNLKDTIETYWESIDDLFESTYKQNSSFDQYIKYAWEHKVDSQWIIKISEVLKQTDVLVIIGYSFPPFNREIDQFLFSKIDTNKIKKIVYQDPNAEKQIIENLFEYPKSISKKIEIENTYLNQFYIPNEYFIVQNSFRRSIY